MGLFASNYMEFGSPECDAFLQTEEGKPLLDFLTHAGNESPKECGGFLVERHSDGKKEFVACRNVAIDPMKETLIPFVDRVRAGSIGRILAHCHSHPNKPMVLGSPEYFEYLAHPDVAPFRERLEKIRAEAGDGVAVEMLTGSNPSPGDMRVCDETGLPFLILGSNGLSRRDPTPGEGREQDPAWQAMMREAERRWALSPTDDVNTSLEKLLAGDPEGDRLIAAYYQSELNKALANSQKPIGEAIR